MKQDYYIGLDMGTESVGWAVTDVDYNLVKKTRTGLLGRLFIRRSENRARSPRF